MLILSKNSKKLKDIQVIMVNGVRTVTRILIQLYVSIKMKENKKKKIKIKIEFNN